jgi:hypothetical protein
MRAMKQQGSTDSRKVLSLFSTSLVFSVVIVIFKPKLSNSFPVNLTEQFKSGGSIAKQTRYHY